MRAGGGAVSSKGLPETLEITRRGGLWAGDFLGVLMVLMFVREAMICLAGTTRSGARKETAGGESDRVPSKIVVVGAVADRVGCTSSAGFSRDGEQQETTIDGISGRGEAGAGPAVDLAKTGSQHLVTNAASREDQVTGRTSVSETLT